MSVALAPVGQAAIIENQEKTMISIHPTWMPILLDNDRSAYVVEIIDSVPMISFPVSGPCVLDVAGADTSASCSVAFSIDLPLDQGPPPEVLAALAENGIEVDPFSPIIVLPASDNYETKCWYIDTNHYRCCYYYESGMVTCYDYYYSCKRTGYYGRTCGWSSQMTYHKCDV